MESVNEEKKDNLIPENTIDTPEEMTEFAGEETVEEAVEEITEYLDEEDPEEVVRKYLGEPAVESSQEQPEIQEVMEEAFGEGTAPETKKDDPKGSGILLLLVAIIAIFAIMLGMMYVQMRAMGEKLEENDKKIEALLEQMSFWKDDLEEEIESVSANFYESRIEEEQEEPEVVENKHKVYLTFDDGPSKYTDEILDILDHYQVKATFFVIGKEDDHSKEMLKRIVAEGHTLAMHSYSHKYSELYSSMEAFEEDFEKLRTFLYEQTGYECVHYRFPGGSSNTVSELDMIEFAQFLADQGVTYHDWNVSSGDATNKTLTVEELIKNSTENLENRGTSVVLLHDAADKYTTVQALPGLIEEIQNMDDTVILPISEDMKVIQHIHLDNNQESESR